MAKKSNKETKVTMAETAVTHILAQAGNKSSFELRREVAEFANSGNVISRYRRVIRESFSSIIYLTDIVYMLTDGSLFVSRRYPTSVEWYSYASLKEYQDMTDTPETKGYEVEFKQIGI